MSAPPPLQSKVRPSRETLGERMLQHGHTVGYSMSPTYRCWLNMRNRCRNPRMECYPRYGGRGIKVCERWDSFALFLADMGERPSRTHTLDRRDNDGNYEPGNCHWTTYREQRRNQTRNRAVIRSDGLRFRTMIEAAEATGANRKCIYDVCHGNQKTHLGFTWRFAE